MKSLLLVLTVLFSVVSARVNLDVVKDDFNRPTSEKRLYVSSENENVVIAIFNTGVIAMNSSYMTSGDRVAIKFLGKDGIIITIYANTERIGGFTLMHLSERSQTVLRDLLSDNSGGKVSLSFSTYLEGKVIMCMYLPGFNEKRNSLFSK